MIRRCLKHFNSIKVRLELLPTLSTLPGCLFQFHKGTIRTYYIRGKIKRCSHFNSIKVRLELSFSTEYVKAVANFNSIKVRLELLVVPIALITCLYFNSIKVRLEPFQPINQIFFHHISIP